MIREFNGWFEAGLNDQANGTNTQSTLFANHEVPDIMFGLLMVMLVLVKIII